MSTLNFPSGPSADQEYSFGSNTWKWNGKAWDAVAQSVAGGTAIAGGTGFIVEGTGGFLTYYDSVLDNPSGFTLSPADTLYWDSTNQRLGIKTTSPTVAVDVASGGMSVVGGATFDQTTVSGLLYGLGGITLGSGITWPDGTYQSTAPGPAGGGTAYYAGDGLSSTTPFIDGTAFSIDSTATISVAGVSMNASGITFPDGTYQSTASAGGGGGGTAYYAGDGLSSAPSGDGTAFSIDSTATISVGGITLTSSGITFADGTYQNTSASQYVQSLAGFTGILGAGITYEQVLYAGLTGIDGSADLTFGLTSGILTIGQGGWLDARMQGPHIFLCKADEAIAAGDPVYITGTVGGSDRVTVAKADAADSAKMPAAGIAIAALSLNEEGEIVFNGTVDFDTTGLNANDSLWVASGGGTTTTRPSGANDLVQKVARVKRENSSNGSLIVAGAFRSNDVPNFIYARHGICGDNGITAGGDLNVYGTSNLVNTNISGGATLTSTLQVDGAATFDGTLDANGDVTITGHHVGSGGANLSGGITLDVAKVTGIFNTLGGISMDVLGITFPDGTYQATAATGSGVQAGTTSRLAYYDSPTTIASASGLQSVDGNNLIIGNDLSVNNRLLAYNSAFISNGLTADDVKITSGLTGTFFLYNAGGANISGGITLDDVKVTGTLNAAGGISNAGTVDIIGGDTVTPALSILDDSTGTDAAPIIELTRDPSDDGFGANADYLGQIKFNGQSDSGTERVYAKITGKIGSATNADEDGVVEHMVRADGAADIIFRTQKDGIAFTDGKALRFEGDTNNTNETTLYVVDPTADRTVNLPDASGTVALVGQGITFPDNSYQSTAAAGGTAYYPGDGLVTGVGGQTFSIDSGAVLHVAGISSDGGITAAGTLDVSGNATLSGTVTAGANALDIDTLTDSTGIVVSTAAGAVTHRQINNGNGITVTNGTGVGGNPSVSARLASTTSLAFDGGGLALSGDAIGIASQKFYGTNTSGTKGWYDFVIDDLEIVNGITGQAGANLYIPGGSTFASTLQVDGAMVAGTRQLNYDDLTGKTGLITCTASGLVNQRSIAVGDGLTGSNLDGVSGNPTVAVESLMLVNLNLNDSTNWTDTSSTFNFDFGNVAASSYGMISPNYAARLLAVTYKGVPVGSMDGGQTFTLNFVASRESGGGTTILSQSFNTSIGSRHIERHAYEWADGYEWAVEENVHVTCTGRTGTWNGSNYMRRNVITMTFGIHPSNVPVYSS